MIINLKKTMFGIIRGHSFSFIELNKYIDFIMNLLVRERI